MKRDEFLRKWYDALRSGKYKQDYGRLRSKRGYCCLGVACSISKRGKWIRSSSGYLFQTQYTILGGKIPSIVAEMAGIDVSLENRLSTMNDNGELFKKIAAFIRKKFPDAFKSTSRKISR